MKKKLDFSNIFLFWKLHYISYIISFIRRQKSVIYYRYISKYSHENSLNF